MKSRLAKKIAHTPLDRLAPSWRKRFVRHDARVVKVLSKWNKRAKNNAHEF